MSIDRNFYVIAGYDLNGYKTDKYEDWSWTEEGEKYRYYQRKGYIQLFDDPMNGCHLYFGYILAEGDMYEFKTTKFDINEVQRQEPFVRIKLRQLIDKGVIDEAIMSKPPEYKVIVFEECR